MTHSPLPRPGPQHETLSPMGRHRYRYTFRDGGYRFEMSVSPDGESWQPLMEGDYRPT